MVKRHSHPQSVIPAEPALDLIGGQESIPAPQMDPRFREDDRG
jgi:hypothetical protein